MGPKIDVLITNLNNGLHCDHFSYCEQIFIP